MQSAVPVQSVKLTHSTHSPLAGSHTPVAGDWAQSRLEVHEETFTQVLLSQRSPAAHCVSKRHCTQTFESSSQTGVAPEHSADDVHGPPGAPPLPPPPSRSSWSEPQAGRSAMQAPSTRMIVVRDERNSMTSTPGKTPRGQAGPPEMGGREALP